MEEKKELLDLEQELIDLDKLYKETYDTTDQITRDFYRKRTEFPFESYKEKYKSFADFKKKILGEVVKEDNTLTREKISIIKDGSSSASKKRYVITAAIEGDTLCRPFYKALLSYVEKNNAELVILPMRGVLSHHKGYSEDILEFQHFFATEYKFNDNIKCIDLKLHPRQFLPLSQINRLGYDTSFIVAHSKIQFESSPVPMGKIPHVIQSTGAITMGSTYGGVRTGKISERDHNIGAAILEIVDNHYFHLRDIEFDLTTESFYDLDKQYFADGKVKQARLETLYLGDYHSGYTVQEVIDETHDMISFLKPKQIFVGDVFDGTSISHHSINNIKAQIQRPEHLFTLEKELNHLAMNLKSFIQRSPGIKLNIVNGNHEDHLEFYLRECRYKDDRLNHLLALKLAIHMIENRNPIQEYVFSIFPELRKSIRFLSRHDSIKIAGIEHANHGDISAKGIKAGIAGIEKSLPKANIGHGHAPKIYRGLRMAGAMCKPDMPYIKSSMTDWMHTHIGTYPNGMRQMYHIILTDNYRGWRMS